MNYFLNLLRTQLKNLHLNSGLLQVPWKIRTSSIVPDLEGLTEATYFKYVWYWMMKFPYHKFIHLITITNPLRQVEQELTPSFINSSTWPWGVWGLSKTTATKVFKPNILTLSPVNSVLLRWVQNFEYTHCFGIAFQWVDVQLNSKWLLPSRYISKCRDQRSFHNTNLCINRMSTG